MKKRLLSGALGGALGGLAMKAVVHFADPDAFGLSAKTDAKSTHDLRQRMHWPRTSEKQAERMGAAMHYAFAVAAGVGYSAAAYNFPQVRAGRGAVFGAALWLVGGELAISLAGLEDPRRTPLFSHVSALGAHVVYGMIVDAASARK